MNTTKGATDEFSGYEDWLINPIWRCGTIWQVGELRYYCKDKTGAIPWPQGQVPAAGDLPATKDKPDFWDIVTPERRTVHAVQKDWNCCVRPLRSLLWTQGAENDVFDRTEYLW